MRFQVNLMILGTRTFQGKKDPSKIYREINFIDGGSTCSMLTDDVDLFSKACILAQCTPCNLTVDLSLGKYTQCKIITLEAAVKE